MKNSTKIIIAITALILVACGKSESADKTVANSASEKKALVEASSSPLSSREPSMNASPLGIELGYANLAGVKQVLGKQTNLTEVGTNEHSGGVMLVSDGQGLGVEGLTKLVAIFDKTKTLVAVVMTMPKNVNSTYSKLSEKYKTVSNNIDLFMGNGSAKLEKGDSWVMIEAPHLSFQMDVMYATKGFMADVERDNEDSRAKKEQEQKSKL